MQTAASAGRAHGPGPAPLAPRAVRWWSKPQALVSGLWLVVLRRLGPRGDGFVWPRRWAHLGVCCCSLRCCLGLGVQAVLSSLRDAVDNLKCGDCSAP